MTNPEHHTPTPAQPVDWCESTHPNCTAAGPHAKGTNAIHNPPTPHSTAARTIARIQSLTDAVRQLQPPDPNTGDRSVSFYALMEALNPDDQIGSDPSAAGGGEDLSSPAGRALMLREPSE